MGDTTDAVRPTIGLYTCFEGLHLHKKYSEWIIVYR